MHIPYWVIVKMRALWLCTFLFATVNVMAAGLKRKRSDDAGSRKVSYLSLVRI